MVAATLGVQQVTAIVLYCYLGEHLSCAICWLQKQALALFPL
jgi:hypothetical protein